MPTIEYNVPVLAETSKLHGTKPLSLLVKATLFYMAFLVVQFVHISTMLNHANANNANANANSFNVPSATWPLKEGRAVSYFQSEMVELTNILTKQRRGGTTKEKGQKTVRGYLQCLTNIFQQQLLSESSSGRQVSRNMNKPRYKYPPVEDCGMTQTKFRSANKAPLPPLWANFTFNRMYNFCSCPKHAADQQKTLYDKQHWLEMRTRFWNFVGAPEAARCGTRATTKSDWKAPYAAGYTPDGKGRGVFAARDIRKGELVHTSWANTAFFQHGHMWRDFIFTLPNKLACDVMEWSWMQHLEEEGDYVFCLNMDNSALLNSGGPKNSNIEMKNMHSLDFYATRDIEKGEEIMYDYFRFYNNYQEFGL